MSVDVQEKKQYTSVSKKEEKSSSRASLFDHVRAIEWSKIQWRVTLLTAIVMAVGWCSLFLMSNWIQFLAGIVPVSAGLFLGRKINHQVLLHGLILGVSGFLIGLLLCAIYAMIGSTGMVPMPRQLIDPALPPVTLTPFGLIQFYVSFSLFAMIPFPAFGTVIAHRNEQRRREMDAQVTVRGGQLESAGVVRTLEDLQGLSLPQFGTYVRALFVKNGFNYKDYRFLDKDKHLDLEMEYSGDTYMMRLSVADKVRMGTIETLVQDMKKKHITKGLVVTSTEFTPDVQKSAKGRHNIVLIDGQTLFDMAQR